MTKASRNQIYEAVICRMVRQALQEQEAQFAALHEGDDPCQYIGYLRHSAEKLGHTPWPREITGGQTIEDYFGSWVLTLEAAELPYPTHENRQSQFARYRQEAVRQRAIYREKKLKKKQLVKN